MAPTSIFNNPELFTEVEGHFFSPPHLSQAEIQTLLHFLREELSFITSAKDEYKQSAARQWPLCIKGTITGTYRFHLFSVESRAYQECKAKEKKLVSLITKLKGMR